MKVRFMGITLHATPGVLVPRAETELLGYAALSAIRDCATPPRVIDMCCGAGNLVCALAHHAPDALFWASDLTDACVAATRHNIAQLGFGSRVVVGQGDLFAGLAGLSQEGAGLEGAGLEGTGLEGTGLEGTGLEGTVDVIVCNPPYISQAKLAGERASLLEHEPREAFDGGPYGLTVHQRVLREALPFLRPGGTLLFEFGLGQARQLELLFKRCPGYDAPQWTANEAGEPRVVSARKQGKIAP
jgi:release factor glutamine methyltransferase